MSRCKAPVASFAMVGLPPLSTAARLRMELWASSYCSEWSFPPGGFTGKLLEEKAFHALQVQLTTQLKRWGVPKPSSGWLQLSKSGPAPPPPPPKRQRTEAEKKAAQRAKKKREAENIAQRAEYERLPPHERERGEAWLMGQDDPLEQRRTREREAAEKKAAAAERAAEEQEQANEREDMAAEDFDAPPVGLPALAFD
jgi:hypothetical protein